MFFCWSIYPEKIYVHLHVHNVLYYSVYLQNTLYLYSYIINFVPRVVKIDAYVVHKIFTLETIFRIFFMNYVYLHLWWFENLFWQNICAFEISYKVVWASSHASIYSPIFILFCDAQKKLALSWIIQFVYCYVLKYVFRVSTLQGVDVCHLTNKMI